MARRFAIVSEEEIEEAFFSPSDLVNTETTITLRVGEERWKYISTSPSADSCILLSLCRALWRILRAKMENLAG